MCETASQIQSSVAAASVKLKRSSEGNRWTLMKREETLVTLMSPGGGWKPRTGSKLTQKFSEGFKPQWRPQSLTFRHAELMKRQ